MPDYDAIIKAVENDKPLPKNVIDIPDVKESHTSYINRMQELNERISQLTDLVNSASDTIENTREMIKLVEQERDRLADQRREQEPKFERVKENEEYFFIRFDGNDGLVVVGDEEQDDPLDKAAYENNNYFKTKQRAQEVADKINFLLKLERLHDIYCPDYVPDWGNDTETYIIPYGMIKKRYFVSCVHACWTITYVYFPTREIAQKVCDILNKELEER